MRRFTKWQANIFLLIDLLDFFWNKKLGRGGGGGLKIKINWKISLRRSNKYVFFLLLLLLFFFY